MISMQFYHLFFMQLNLAFLRWNYIESKLTKNKNNRWQFKNLLTMFQNLMCNYNIADDYIMIK